MTRRWWKRRWFRSCHTLLAEFQNQSHKREHARGGPGGGGGLNPSFDPINLDVLVPPRLPTSSSPHREPTPRYPSVSFDVKGGDDMDVAVRYEKPEGG